MTTQVRSVSTVYRERLKRLLKLHAWELLRKYTPSGPPYDPLLVAQGMQVDVQETDLAGIEGYIELKDGKYVAVISKSAQERRRRFTLAHELCHVLLMRKAEDGKRLRLIRFRTNGNLPGLHQDPVEESLCNYFAGELLMPSYEIRALLSEQMIGPNKVLDLAEDYEVSIQTAAIQIVRLLKSQVIACSLWNLESLWPVPVWWTGFETQNRSELQRLEAVAEKKAELVEFWQSYSGRRQSVKVMVTLTPAKRYAVILVVRS